MKINVRIERLVLEGLPFEQRQGTHLQAAVERELTRLLIGPHSTARFDSGRAQASIKGGSIELAACADPAGVGGQIAAAVYSGFGGPQ